MTEEQWRKIKYFSPAEKWGDADKMDFKLIWLLDELRDQMNLPFIVHCGYATEGHSPNSYHYKGQAVDFHVEGLSLYAAWEQIVEKWWMGGAGIYPNWNSPGFHLDVGNYRRW